MATLSEGSIEDIICSISICFAELDNVKNSRMKPSDIVAAINNHLIADEGSHVTMTAQCAVIDSYTNLFDYVSCGSIGLPMYQKNTQSLQVLKMPGHSLGKKSADDFSADLSNEIIRLSEGDVIVFVSDGVVMATSPTQEQYGLSTINKIIKESASQSSTTIATKLRDSLVAFIGDMPQDRDMTVMVMKKG